MQPAPMRTKLNLNMEEVRYYTRQVERVRISSIEKEPFLADNGFRMKIIIGNYHRGTWVNTCATDGKVLIVNPTWYMARTTGGRICVFAHELFHAALGHNLRRGNRKPKLWNIACDHEVNNLIILSGKYEIPTDWVCDIKYKGWACERIYADLLKEMKDQPKPPPQPPGNDPGEEGDEPGEDYDGEDDPTEEEDGEEQDDGDEKESEKSDGEGEGDEDGEDEEAGKGEGDEDEGDKEDKQISESKYGKSEVGEVFDALNDDGTVMDVADRKEALEELARRNEIGKMAEIVAGNDTSVGGHVSMKKLMATDQSWELQLGDFFASKGIPAGDTWKKLNRRGMAQRQFVPAKRFHGIEWMVFARDISYSMDRDSLEALNNVMDKLRLQYNVARVTILPFNTGVCGGQIEEIGLDDEFPTEFDVGGGTSFSPVFRWVDAQDQTPDGIVMFTDMGAYDFPEEPKVPVLWASSEPFWTQGGSSNLPPWGETIEIEVRNGD